jgi:hypothetical protein
MVRIIKKSNEAYFSLGGIPYRYSNGSLEKLDESNPYYHVLMGYEKLKEEVKETDTEINVGDITYMKETEELIGEPDEETENAIIFMNESEEVEGDDSVIKLDEETEVGLDNSSDGSGEAVVKHVVSEEEQDDDEKKLLLEKIEQLEKNIKNLENADINTDDELQDLYLKEVGKRALLQERLDELGVDRADKKQTIIEKLSESYGYQDLRKNKTMGRLLESHKMGSKVMAQVVKASKNRLIESIKTMGKVKLTESLDVDYEETDGKFVFSGDSISRLVEEEILVVEESDFFDVFDKIVKAIDGEDTGEEEVILEESEEEEEIESDIVVKLPETPTHASETINLEDGKYYVLKCDVYSNTMGEQSPIMKFDSYLLARAGFVLQYLASEDTFIDEYGATYDISPIYVAEHEPVLPQELEENESDLVVVDDGNNSHDVTFEGISKVDGDQITELYEFKNRFKESVFIPKNDVVVRLRRKAK